MSLGAEHTFNLPIEISHCAKSLGTFKTIRTIVLYQNTEIFLVSFRSIEKKTTTKCFEHNHVYIRTHTHWNMYWSHAHRNSRLYCWHTNYCYCFAIETSKSTKPKLDLSGDFSFDLRIFWLAY